MSSAAWALLGVVIGTLCSGAVNYYLQKERFKHEKTMFALERQGEEMVKLLLKEMLSHKGYIDRSFEALSQPIGGYSEDKIRQLLHELDAQKVNKQGQEWWYLNARKDERIKYLRQKKARAETKKSSGS